MQPNRAEHPPCAFAAVRLGRDSRLSAYDGLGPAWQAGPGPVYQRLAEPLVSALGPTIAGGLVLDVGAGTGAACGWIERAGGRPVALDPAVSMLAVAGRRLSGAGPALLATGGAAGALPFPAATFQAVVAGFCLSHMDSPEEALREGRRVLAPGGRLAASVFLATSNDPSKAAVEEVAGQYGFSPPAWYRQMKASELRIGSSAALRRLAASAGLWPACVEERLIDVGLGEPKDFVSYRLGMAHLAPFVASLAGSAQRELRQRAIKAICASYVPWRPRVLILSSRTPA